MSGIRRSASTPCTRINSSNYVRARSRQCDISYESSKDMFCHSIGAWSCDETCCMLNLILARARLSQLEHLWTAMEPAVHRDFLKSPEAHDSKLPIRPYSTPITREIRQRFSRSRRPENHNLHRVSSTTLIPEVTTVMGNLALSLHERCKSENHFRVVPEATPTFKLPGLRSEPHRRAVSLAPHISRSTAPPSSPTQAWSPHVPMSRIPFPQKRHMVQEEWPGTHLLRPEQPLTTFQPTQHPGALLSTFSPGGLNFTLPLRGLHFLQWFSNLTEDWQQQEILQILVWNLDPKELHYFISLLKRHQYRDFIADLPEDMSLLVLKYIPAKELLRFCCRVSTKWQKRCSNEKLWEVKCHRNRIDLPMQGVLSWRRTFVDDLKLKRNWKFKRCIVQCLRGHTGRVLCVRIREEDGVIATGGSDRTVRLWNASNGECTGVLFGHMKPVWCLCFLGKNLLVSGSGDSSLKVWNTSTGECGRHLQAHKGPVWTAQIKKDVLISGSHDHSAIVWDIRRCSVLRALEGHNGAVFSVDLDESSELAFTASGDKTVGVWQLSSGLCLKRLKHGNGHPVVALQWHEGYIASCSSSTITLWSVDGWKKVIEFQGHEDRVECVQLRVRDPANCAGTVLSSSRDKTIKYWDIHSGRCLQTLSGHAGPVNGIHWNEVFIASASDDSDARIWDFHPSCNRVGLAPS